METSREHKHLAGSYVNEKNGKQIVLHYYDQDDSPYVYAPYLVYTYLGSAKSYNVTADVVLSNIEAGNWSKK